MRQHVVSRKARVGSGTCTEVPGRILLQEKLFQFGCFCIKVRKLSQSSHSGDIRNPIALIPLVWRLEARIAVCKAVSRRWWTHSTQDNKLRDSVDVVTPKIFNLKLV